MGRIRQGFHVIVQNLARRVINANRSRPSGRVEDVFVRPLHDSRLIRGVHERPNYLAVLEIPFEDEASGFGI